MGCHSVYCLSCLCNFTKKCCVGSYGPFSSDFLGAVTWEYFPVLLLLLCSCWTYTSAVICLWVTCEHSAHPDTALCLWVTCEHCVYPAYLDTGPWVLATYPCLNTITVGIKHFCDALQSAWIRFIHPFLYHRILGLFFFNLFTTVSIFSGQMLGNIEFIFLIF